MEISNKKRGGRDNIQTLPPTEEVRMSDHKFKTRTIRSVALATGLAMAIVLWVGPAMAAGGVDPDADKILRAMSSYLGRVPTFSMTADIDTEIVNLDGQKLQMSATSTIVIARPDKFHIARQGMVADAEFIFDGNTLTIHGKRKNVYAQIESPGTIDDAIRTFESETGLDAPGADLLLAEPYLNLSAEVISGTYLGIAYVDGLACHHLAFRQARVDWQLWVKTGDEPLPMKYVITSKWITGAPQYAVRLRDWKTGLKTDDNQFMFSVPEGAKRLETIPVNETGELGISEEGQK